MPILVKHHFDNATRLKHELHNKLLHQMLPHTYTRTFMPTLTTKLVCFIETEIVFPSNEAAQNWFVEFESLKSTSSISSASEWTRFVHAEMLGFLSDGLEIVGECFVSKLVFSTAI